MYGLSFEMMTLADLGRPLVNDVTDELLYRDPPEEGYRTRRPAISDMSTNGEREIYYTMGIR